jgi:hypothetical protein
MNHCCCSIVIRSLIFDICHVVVYSYISMAAATPPAAVTSSAATDVASSPSTTTTETKCEEGMSMMMATTSVSDKKDTGPMTPFRECEIKYRLKPLPTTIASAGDKKKKHRTGRIRYEKTDFSDAIDFDDPTQAVHIEQVINVLFISPICSEARNYIHADCMC